MRNTHTFYRAWAAMKQRCNNPSGRDLPYYIGINYDDKWEYFINFYNDMIDSWEKGLSLDRIDGTKGYSKSNCRWATPKQQSNNTKRNRIIEINGKKDTLITWIERSGIKPSTVKQRFYVYGWSIEKSLGMEE